MKNALLRIFFMTMLFISSSTSWGQKEELVSLSSELNRMADNYKVVISYSYNLIEPYQVNRTKDKDLSSDLNELFKGLPLSYKKVDETHYFIFAKEDMKDDKTSPILTIAKVVPAHDAVTSMMPYPRFALKTNILYDITSTASLGVEWAFHPQWSLDVSGVLNLWTSSDESIKFKNMGIQPELRYWLCNVFQGSFVGVHAHYDKFNIGKLPSAIFCANMNENRYEGRLYGLGFSYGYHWLLSNRWSIEAVLGFGYAHINYDKYPCVNCGSKIKSDNRNYIGPTKAAVNLIYMIK